VCQSAEGWVADFGVDGLRLDAIHAIFDSSAEHIVAAVARRVHAVDPDAYVIAESGLNDPAVMRPRERGGHGCDAAWSDDFHHALHALLTGERDGYYADFGRVSQLAKALHRPHVFDGGYSSFRRRRFGAPADDVNVSRFVVYSQDHDQVGNRAFGDRLPPDVQRLAALITLTAPFVALLFMGEEYGERAPFRFFTDHDDPEIAEATRRGRRQELDVREIPDPQDPATFAASRLTRVEMPGLRDLYRDLLTLRRELPDGIATEPDDEARTLRARRGAHVLEADFRSKEASFR
jgi:maltooligosyltrehalose trehalohydrolase